MSVPARKRRRSNRHLRKLEDSKHMWYQRNIGSEWKFMGCCLHLGHFVSGFNGVQTGTWSPAVLRSYWTPSAGECLPCWMTPLCLPANTGWSADVVPWLSNTEAQTAPSCLRKPTSRLNPPQHSSRLNISNFLKPSGIYFIMLYNVVP